MLTEVADSFDYVVVVEGIMIWILHFKRMVFFRILVLLHQLKQTRILDEPFQQKESNVKTSASKKYPGYWIWTVGMKKAWITLFLKPFLAMKEIKIRRKERKVKKLKLR